MAAPIAQHLSNVNRQRLAEIITNSGTWQKGAAIGGKTGRRMTPKPGVFLEKVSYRRAKSLRLTHKCLERPLR